MVLSDSIPNNEFIPFTAVPIAPSATRPGIEIRPAVPTAVNAAAKANKEPVSKIIPPTFDTIPSIIPVTDDNIPNPVPISVSADPIIPIPAPITIIANPNPIRAGSANVPNSAK